MKINKATVGTGQVGAAANEDFDHPPSPSLPTIR